jgi:hypothetical protein
MSLNSYTEILTLQINPGVGIGGLKLGMKVEDILDYTSGYDSYYLDKVLKVNAYYPNIYSYSFFDSVDLYVDIKEGVLVEIRMRNKFSSKYLVCVGIGDKVGSLNDICDNLEFDEEDVYIEGDSRLIMVADEDLMSLSDEEVYDCLIEEMIIKAL